MKTHRMLHGRSKSQLVLGDQVLGCPARLVLPSFGPSDYSTGGTDHGARPSPHGSKGNIFPSHSSFGRLGGLGTSLRLHSGCLNPTGCLLAHVDTWIPNHRVRNPAECCLFIPARKWPLDRLILDIPRQKLKVHVSEGWTIRIGRLKLETRGDSAHWLLKIDTDVTHVRYVIPASKKLGRAPGRSNHSHADPQRDQTFSNFTGVKTNPPHDERNGKRGKHREWNSEP